MDKVITRIDEQHGAHMRAREIRSRREERIGRSITLAASASAAVVAGRRLQLA
jgi:hypothetical protein